MVPNSTWVAGRIQTFWSLADRISHMITIRVSSKSTDLFISGMLYYQACTVYVTTGYTLYYRSQGQYFSKKFIGKQRYWQNSVIDSLHTAIYKSIDYFWCFPENSELSVHFFDLSEFGVNVADFSATWHHINEWNYHNNRAQENLHHPDTASICRDTSLANGRPNAKSRLLW